MKKLFMRAKLSGTKMSCKAENYFKVIARVEKCLEKCQTHVLQTERRKIDSQWSKKEKIYIRSIKDESDHRSRRAGVCSS